MAVNGRPRKYKTSKAFDDKVDEYIARCAQESLPITWTGLALHLGFSSRKDIDMYLNYEGFSHSVKRAKLIVENAYELRLNGDKPTGAIFALKNFGWIDKPAVLDEETRDNMIQIIRAGAQPQEVCN